MNKLLLFLSIFILSITFTNREEAKALENSNYLLLSEESKHTEVTEYLKKNKAYNITSIEEIGLIHYSSKENAALKKKLINRYPKNIKAIERAKSSDFHFKETKTFKHLDFKKNKIVHNNIKTKHNRNATVDIVTIDSGIDYTHPDLRNIRGINKGRNFVSNEKDIFDDNGHGTQIVGLMGKYIEKYKLNNVNIIPYKVMTKEDGESIWVIEAIIEAAKNKADIINLSLGTYKELHNEEDALIIEAYEKAIKFANKKGSILIASVGNENINLDEINLNKIHLPGGASGVLTVSGVDKDSNFATYSNYGESVDFSAFSGSLKVVNQKIDPTYLVYTTVPLTMEKSVLDNYFNTPSGYTYNLGTSLSTAYVSISVAALITEYEKKYNSKPTKKEVIYYLNLLAIDLGDKGKDIFYGNGEIKMEKIFNFKHLSH